MRLGSQVFFWWLWQFRKIGLMNGLQKAIKLNEKVIKLDYFWGAMVMAVVMVFFDPLLPLKYRNLFYAKLV